MSLVRRFALASALTAATPALASPAYDAVDPLIGTGGEGHTFPGAVAPFGMVQLSPDTDTTCMIRDCYGHAAGYRYSRPDHPGLQPHPFLGRGAFRPWRLPGDAGQRATRCRWNPATPTKPGSGYRSRFGHATEVAQPGYYAVTLADPGVRAEMTAGTRIGVHRYTFPRGKAAHLVLDLRTSLYNYPGKILWSSIRLHPDGTITGARETRGWAPERKLYFAMRFSAPLTGSRLPQHAKTTIPYKGFQGPGRGSDALAEKLGARWSPGSISGSSTARSR